MIKSISSVFAIAATLFVAMPARATAPTANFGVFYVQNSSASGLGNPGFCTSLAHDALAQNGFTSIGESSPEVWGYNGDTLVVIGCVPWGPSSQWAGVQIVAAGPVYSTTEYWRNTLRAHMQNARWL